MQGSFVIQDPPGTNRARFKRGLIVLRAISWITVCGLGRWLLRLGLPLVLIAVVLHSFPYTTTVEGVSFRVQGTILHRPGLSADTTLGNWEFRTVDWLPFGVHVSPQNVDVVALAEAANSDVTGFADRLQESMKDQLPHVVIWLLAETLLGLLLGLAASAVVNMAIRYLRRLPRRDDELKHRVRQLSAGLAVTVLVVGYGVVSFNDNWLRQSRLTGTLAAAQLFPNQLKAYYQKSKAQDVLGSVVGIQGALQATIDQQTTPDTALRIMFISDVHLAAVYPLVAQYARNYAVDLIINTGDESEFGTKTELTPTYLQAIRDLTKTTPMLWLAGNHDSPDVQSVMSGIPHVTVLGEKTATADGFSVSAGVVQAFGLRIAGLPDPRVYGGVGAYGSDAPNVTDPLERKAADDAVATTPKDGQKFDIFATHEPVTADELRKQLPGLIRQTNAGHVHAQNQSGDIQRGDGISLVEGSTGAGGLDNIVRGASQPPIEFSIESVSATCQFTRILRFQIRSQAVIDEKTPQAFGDDVTVSTVYFRPQEIDADRVCGPETGVGPHEPLP
jgi:predicted MPP superfamily phosphohydrolase